MPSRAIKPKREDDHLSGGGWQGLGERAPSLVRPEQATPGRVLALVALFPLTLGAASLFFSLVGRGYLIPPGWGVVLLLLGVGGLLYHAFNERDQQYLRLYWVIGLVLFALGILFRLLPSEAGLGGETFLRFGAPALLLALGFLGATVRHEADPVFRRLTLNGLGIAGAACALLGFVGGVLSESFLLANGLVLLLLGLLYLATYAGLQETGSDRAYWAGFGIGVLGGLMVLVSLGLSILPPLLYQWGLLESAPGPFFMPRGLLLLYAGIEFLLFSFGMCSDSKLAVLTRRELAAYFYSPIAYVVLIGIALIGWFNFNLFTSMLLQPDFGTTADRVISGFVISYIPVFCMVLVVPLLTMRLLSEERRTGSLEVLLTAPVNETSVVLSKFLAALRVFLLGWYPWGIYLLALRLETLDPADPSRGWFDYRPLLSFFIALTVTGAAWMAMGLFFSSLTRNQITAAAMTLVAMIFLTAVFWLWRAAPADSVWRDVLRHISFINLWWESSEGKVAPRDLVFHLTAAVFWLFLTVKVLEARKWT
jgi:ABC-2 type transport system permease protein